MLPKHDTHTRRLNRVAYTNLGLGLFSLLAWAIPGPWMIGVFWRMLDQTGAHGRDDVSIVVTTIMKAMVVLIVVGFWVLSAVSLANGYLILKRRRHRPCLLLSGVSVLGTPLGFVVGVVSLVVLTQEWARDQFAELSPVAARSGWRT